MATMSPTACPMSSSRISSHRLTHCSQSASKANLLDWVGF